MFFHHKIAHDSRFIPLLDWIQTGPDVEFLQEILHHVGKRHGQMGVEPCYFPYLGKSIVWAMKQTIGDEWSADDQAAWEVMYETISIEMIKAIVEA